MQANERKKSLKTMNDVEWMLERLWAPIVAVSAAHEERANALISSTAVSASLLPEAPAAPCSLRAQA
jgi:hypothetical protein